MPKFWDTEKYKNFHLEQMENLLLLGIPIFKHITVLLLACELDIVSPPCTNNLRNKWKGVLK